MLHGGLKTLSPGKRRITMTKIINLTPNGYDVYAADGSIKNIPPSGDIARVTATVTTALMVADAENINGIIVAAEGWGKVEGLPAPQPGIVYLVGRNVKERVPDRDDVLVLGPPARDEGGKIIAAHGLCR
jgi:hypothetical protein